MSAGFRTPPQCAPDAAGHCITCSDEGTPMRVLGADSATGLALCEGAGGHQSEVMTALIGEVVPGDVLLVHAGTALVRLEENAFTPDGHEASA